MNVNSGAASVPRNRHDRLIELMHGYGSGAGDDKQRAVWRIATWKVAQEAADREITQAVTKARREGVSWFHIGETLGISKQAAQQKYGETAQSQRETCCTKGLCGHGSTPVDADQLTIDTEPDHPEQETGWTGR